jgi:hypothetical protein
MTRHFAIGALALACALGCGKAELSDMVPGGSVASGAIECWLTIEFTGEPGAIDPRSVQVEFDGIMLAEPQVYDWEFIASHDERALGLGKGFARNEATQPDAPPPIGVPIKVRYPIPAMQVVNVGAGQDLDLKATLYWGGKKQDSMTRSLAHVYAGG